MPGGIQSEGQRRPEPSPDRQVAGGGHVIPDGHPETSGQGLAELPPQRDPVPGDGRGHEHRSRDHQPPPGGRHPDEHRQGSQGEQAETPALRAVPGLVGPGLEQGRCEVLAPHEHGVRQGPEQHQVHHQPSGFGHQAMGRGDDHGAQQPDDDGVVAGAIAARTAGPSPTARPPRLRGPAGFRRSRSRTGGGAHARTAEWMAVAANNRIETTVMAPPIWYRKVPVRAPRTRTTMPRCSTASGTHMAGR